MGKKLNLKEFNMQRRRLQSYTWYGLLLVIIGGWLYPKIGFLLLGCMAGAFGVAVFNGRQWCDFFCPRGSFYDLLLDKISKKTEVPSLLRSTGMRIGIICLLFTMLGVQITSAWPDFDSIGQSFTILLTVTTLVGILLGIGIHPRAWCHICPMGTIAYLMSTGKKPLIIADTCIDCALCSKVCPMQLAPYKDKKYGEYRDNDCIKCGTCVIICPKHALSFALKKAS